MLVTKMLLSYVPMLLKGLKRRNDAMKQQRLNMVAGVCTWNGEGIVELNKAILKGAGEGEATRRSRLSGLPAKKPCFHA